MGSGEWIPWLALLVSTTFALLIELSSSEPQVLSFMILSPKSEPSAVWGLVARWGYTTTRRLNQTEAVAKPRKIQASRAAVYKQQLLTGTPPCLLIHTFQAGSQ